jgi:predicted ATPase
MEVPGQEPLEYALWVRPQGIAHAIREETLSQIRKPHPKPFLHIDSLEREVKYYDPEKKKLTHPTWEHNPLETSLAQVPKMFQEPEDFRRRLASSTFYHVLSVEPRSPVRLPQSLGPAELPGRNGEDLFPVSSISNRPTVTGSMQSKIRFAPRFHDLNGWISRRLQRVRWHWHGVSVGFRSRSTRTNCRKELCGSYG